MGWSPEQVRNAALIYQVGQQMGMSTRDIQIGIITAMTESHLINLHSGDRDSQGLFQQRPSQGWGSVQQVTDPTYAAGKFFKALRGISNRGSMSMGAAAQAVQRSAYPERYAQHIADARSLWPRITTVAGSPQTDMNGQPYGLPDPSTGLPQPGQQSIPEASAPGIKGMLSGPNLSVINGLSGSSLGGPSQAAASGLSGTPATNPALMNIGPHTNDSIIRPMAETSGSFTKGVDGWRKGVVEMAKRYLGTPYVWGGTAPGGFDCSGLIQYVYGQLGKSMPRISYQQANSGKRVGLNQLRAGDLVAWDNSSRNNGADHIAIYIGHGQIIEAPRPGLSVRIRTLGSNEGAWGVSLG